MKTASLTVVILNYNNFDDTRNCLDSLYSCRFSGQLRLVVVDNASSDDSLIQLKKHFPHVTYILATKNLGFAGGNNLAITQYLDQSDYFLLLNNDTVVTKPEFLTEFMNTPGDIVGTIISYRKHGQILYDFGGLVDPILGRNRHLVTANRHKPPMSTPDYFSGVCLLVMSSVFKKIGLLDPRYFFYYEDADFCLRAEKHGFKLGFYPNCSITHKLSSSANKLGRTKLHWLINSHLRFAVSHLRPTSLPLALLFNLYLRLKYYL